MFSKNLCRIVISSLNICSISVEGHSNWCELIGFCKLGLHVCKISYNSSFFHAFFFSVKRKKKKMCEYNIPLQIFSLEGGTLEFLGRFSTSVLFGGPVSFTDLQLVNI